MPTAGRKVPRRSELCSQTRDEVSLRVPARNRLGACFSRPGKADPSGLDSALRIYRYLKPFHLLQPSCLVHSRVAGGYRSVRFAGTSVRTTATCEAVQRSMPWPPALAGTFPPAVGVQTLDTHQIY